MQHVPEEVRQLQQVQQQDVAGGDLPPEGDTAGGAARRSMRGDAKAVHQAEASATTSSDGADKPSGPAPRRINRRLRPEVVDEMVQLHRSGCTVKEIAQQFGFHRETVATHLKRAGLTLRTSLQDEALCQRVRQTYQTIGTVKGTAQQLGISKDTVRKVWTAGRVSDSPESGLSGCSSCCSVLLADLALCPVPRGGAELSLIVCTGLDLGGSIPDGLASCGGGPSDRPSRSLRVAPADLRPGTRPAHPGPARGSDDLISPQMLGELLGGVLAPPVRVEYRLPLSCTGTCGPPYRSPRITESVPRVVAPIAYPTAFFVQQPGTVARYTNPSQVRIYVISPTHLLSRLAGGEVPPDQVGARAPDPRRGRWRRVLSAWLCGLQALLTHDGAHRVRARLNASAGPGGVDPSVPVGAAGAVEDPLDQGAELLSASCGS